MAKLGEFQGVFKGGPQIKGGQSERGRKIQKIKNLENFCSPKESIFFSPEKIRGLKPRKLFWRGDPQNFQKLLHRPRGVFQNEYPRAQNRFPRGVKRRDMGFRGKLDGLNVKPPGGPNRFQENFGQKNLKLCPAREISNGFFFDRGKFTPPLERLFWESWPPVF